jgi:hypothetical protein
VLPLLLLLLRVPPLKALHLLQLRCQKLQRHLVLLLLSQLLHCHPGLQT